MPETRIRFLALLVVAGFVLLGLRLYQLQVLQGAEHHERALYRRLAQQTIPALRGRILTRDGTVLARDEEAFAITVIPAETDDPAERERLARFLGLTAEELAAALARVDREIRRELGLEGREPEDWEDRERQRWNQARDNPRVVVPDADRVLVRQVISWRWRFPQLDYEKSSRRINPAGRLACHLVGCVGDQTPATWRRFLADSESPLVRAWVAGGGSVWDREETPPEQRRAVLNELQRRRIVFTDPVGREGLELLYDDRLRGRRGLEVVERVIGSARRRPVFTEPGENGRDLVLTIDAGLQGLAESLLGERPGAIVVMDCAAGDVLALASAPGFDLAGDWRQADNYRALNEDERRPLLDRTCREHYYTGSVFKIVAGLAGLEEGAITPASRFNCERHYTPAFSCLGLHGDIDFNEGIYRSCNIYFYNVSDLLYDQPGGDHRALCHWARRAGFGERTGIGLPQEAAGRVMGDHWRRGDARHVAIGQDPLKATVLQVARFMGLVATGGRLIRPRLVLHQEPEETVVAVSPATIAALQAGMRLTVTHDRGTAHDAFAGCPETIEVFGKTGTAQTGVEGRDPSHAWFAGFARLPGNRTVSFAVLHEKSGEHGSAVAPLARILLEELAARDGGGR